MMGIFPADNVDVKVHAQLIGKSRKKLVRQIGIEVADPSRADFHIVRQIRPAAQVDYDFGQRFIQRTARLAEATDAVLVTETFFERLSQRETDIFYGVMIVDFDISLGLQLEIE